MLVFLVAGLLSAATALADEGCWIKVWETKDFTGKSETFNGPQEIANLNAIGWGDEIDALVVGPTAWVILYEDEDFDDTTRYLRPNTKISNLDNIDFSDEADSMKIYCSKPPEWPEEK
jgi:hypothetical protein